MEDTTINPSAHVADDGGELALRLVSERFALVKTVRNGDWLRLLSNLRGGRPSQHFRTSFTLLPHDGLIHLFGQADAQKAGLLFDRRALDTSSALCWPSGYFAKTEHHMHVAADTGEVTLTGGRWAQLITLEALVAACGPPAPPEAGASDASLQPREPPLYNEVSLAVGGVRGLSAVFVRSESAADTLFGIGVRALLHHLFPELPPLPLLRLTGLAPPEAVPRAEQLAVLRERAFAIPEAPPQWAGEGPPTHHAAGGGGGGGGGGSGGGGALGMPRLPIDASEYPELPQEERLALHAAYGIGRSSLHAAFAAIARAEGHASLAPHVARSLCAAASADNVASAREIVRTAAPLLLERLLQRDGAPAASGTTLACLHSVRASVASLRRVAHAEMSDGMLVAFGAQITLSEFVAGATAQRLRAACKWLADWCRKAEGGVCSPKSLVFLLTSWTEAREVDGNSDWKSFLTGKAVANRLAFHSQLVELLEAQQRGDGLSFVEQLYALSSRLRRPCLRLRILQQVLGLDRRFSRDIVHGVVCLAFDVLEEMGGGARRPHPGPPRTPRDDSTGGGEKAKGERGGAGAGEGAGEGEGTGTGESAAATQGGASGGGEHMRPRAPPPSPLAECGGSAGGSLSGSLSSSLDLDGFDEATRLEADALLGEGVPRRPSDPLGEASRRSRVLYYYR